ncbi:flagellar biosynthesis regulator FlhF [Catenovulum agarivorans DS-2]|uniref:Flagellar biosynthesis protein FlhF n=1 Tax=Catenovulum agarivorans DS-2 TaxID=1328313 RepID=W7QBS6_9ALTE|nr:flagellar biosynthesis protein FlhF [Catenovulum agarivorans]EWH09451.1 flagellar biosynthesis regulator FlhF [Catenovulum agarivorans DS-2]
MKIKRFVAKDIRSALNQVKVTLGPDAVIMSNTKVPEGIEIVAAIDAEPTPATSQPAAAAPQAAPMQDDAEEIKMSDSLQSLLQRQNKAPAGFAPSRSERQESDMQKNLRANKQRMMRSLAAAVDQDEAEDDWRNSPLLQASKQQAVSQPTSAQVDAAPANDELNSIKAEMAELRNLLQHQVSGLMWQEMARSEPIRAYIVDRMNKMGIASDVADQIASFLPGDIDQNEAWEHALDLLTNQINVTNNDIMRRGGVVALLGPTGVGKTTTVAKLAAHFAKKHGADSVALVTTDTYRIGAHEQLQTYAKIIGCPCKVVSHSEELADTLHQLRNRKLVLIDTAGVGQRDLRLAEQLDSLMKSTNVKIRSYLVLQATAQRRVLMEAVQQFKRISLSGCIFTKLDESMSLGEIISVAIQNALPIGYLTDGQRVPEDIKAASAQYLTDKAAGLLDERDFSHPYWFTDSARQPIYK